MAAFEVLPARTTCLGTFIYSSKLQIKGKGKERKSEEGKMVESESFHCLEQP